MRRISKSAIYLILSTGSYTPVRGQAPGRMQSLRAFRRTAPRLSVVGRCSVLEAVGAVRRVAILSGPLESTAHSRRSHRGHRAAGKSHRSGVICCRLLVWFWVHPFTPIGVYQGGGHADKQPQDGNRAATKSHRSGVICNRRVWFLGPPVDPQKSGFQC